MDDFSYNGDRMHEKHLQREKDRHALESGRKSAAELRAENGFFAYESDIDWDNAKP